MVSGQKEGGGVVEHAAEHFADFGTERGQFSVLLGSDVTAISGKIERGIGLAVFAVAIRKFADEMRLIAAFRPRLAKIETDGKMTSNCSMGNTCKCPFDARTEQKSLHPLLRRDLLDSHRLLCGSICSSP